MKRAIKLVVIFLLVVAVLCSAVFWRNWLGQLRSFEAMLTCRPGPDCASFYPVAKRGIARNVIFVMGDGMGPGQLQAGRIYLAGPNGHLDMEELPHHGFLRTCCATGITDSSSAMTAMACGTKTKSSSVGLDQQGRRLKNMVELAHAAGKATGVVTDDFLVGGSPAGLLTHVRERHDFAEIARQIAEQAPMDIILGGGRQYFIPDAKSKYGQHEDLLFKAQQRGYYIIQTRDEMLALDPKAKTRVMGVFASNRIQDELKRKEGKNDEPTVKEMTEFALAGLKDRPNGFFLWVEEEMIDIFSHRTNIDGVAGQMGSLRAAADVVLEFAKTHPDTLVIITADHETGGLEIIPGNYKKGDIPKAEWDTRRLWQTAYHSNRNVPLFAEGPGAELLDGEHDNTGMFCVMSGALGLQTSP